MKKIIYILLFCPILFFGQSNSENYVKTITYKKELLGNYQNLSVNITTSDVIINNMGGGSGNISISNNNLSFNFIASWGVNTGLKLGNIKQINSVPMITDLELGPLLTTGNIQSGYFAKIKNNWLIFYSPYFPNSMNINTTTNIPGGSVISNYTVSTGTLYTCPSGQNGGGGGGTIVINRDATSGTIALNVSGGWSEQCSLKTAPSTVVALNSIYAIPDTELGVVMCGDFSTVYKARIKNSKLEFYTDEIIPSMPTYCSIQFNHNFSGNAEDKEEVVTYYDGIGRPIQKIESKKSPNQKDIITHIEYDPFGRQTKEYLPYSKWYGVSDMEFVAEAKPETLAYYSSYDISMHGDPQFETTNMPYSEVEYESSSLNRIKQMGAPGNDWAIPLNSSVSSHTIKQERSTNIADEVRKFKVVFSTGTTEKHNIQIDGFFTESKLYKTIIKDENWVSGFDNTTQEFKDNEGKIILKRTFNLGQVYNTYFVYDIYGNLSYVIPPTASDAIDLAYDNSTVSNRSYPWTVLALIDNDLAESYNRLFSDYDNQYIVNEDLFNKYGGQGGFTLSTNGQNELILNINISTQTSMELKTGEIISLKDIGLFKDGEVGRVSGLDYEYIFSIRNNTLVITGRGKLNSLNVNFIGNTKLTYNTNYPWVSLVDIDPKEANEIEKAYQQIDNSAVLSTTIPNQYNANGGINIAINENDDVFINLNINSLVALKFKKGIVIPLKTERSIEDVELGVFEDNNYKYIFSIKDNSLFIEGSGTFTNILKASNVGPIPISNTIPNSIIGGLCYQYRYDYRNRLVEKKIPGKGWEYIVYDKLNREVLTQDSNLRLQNKWLFTKYDVSNREIYNGQIVYNSPNGATNSVLRAEVQNIVNNNSTINESRSTTFFQNGGININYTNSIFPNQSNTDFTVYSVNYFDDYNFQPNGNEITIPVSSYNINIVGSPKNFSTGNLTRVLSTNEWEINLTAYDKRYRSIWYKSINSYLQTVDIFEDKLDFIGKIIESKTTHSKTGVTTNLVTIDRFSYDFADRLIKHTQKIGNQTEELISFNKYNELGELIQKKVGGLAPLETTSYDLVTTALQTVDYSYNIRGWLKTINNPDQNLTDDLFAFKMNYNTPEFGATPLYNGNVCETKWRTKSNQNNEVRAYKYSYDALSRLIQADYIGNYPLAANPSYTENYNEGNIEYDKNGNITHLERYGLKSNMTSIDKIDDLQYIYNSRSNILRQVVDYADTAGFKDLNTPNNIDYKYDSNGNLIKDINKNIINIEYNHLDLPTKIEFAFTDNPSVLNYGRMDMVYDADGKKISSTIFRSGLTTTYPLKITQYDGDYIYGGEPDLSLQFFNQPEGYVSNNAGVYSYIYQYLDNVGNIRLSYKKSGSALEIVEENNFYPFGLKHKGYNSVYNPVGNSVADQYKYQGQERLEDLGLNWDSFKWRNYDYTIGRFINVDPLAEYYVYNSTYAFQENKMGLGRELEGLELDRGNDLPDVSDLQHQIKLKEEEKQEPREQLETITIEPAPIQPLVDSEITATIGDYLIGAANAFSSDFMWGAGRVDDSAFGHDEAHEAGQDLGDAAALLCGIGEDIIAFGGGVLSIVFELPSGGTSTIVLAGSIELGVHGTGVIVTSATNLMSSGGRGGGSGDEEADEPSSGNGNNKPNNAKKKEPVNEPKEHRTNRRPSNWNKHTKPRAGRTNTKNRSKPNWKPNANKRK